MTPSAFELDTAVEPVTTGVWGARCSGNWFTVRGPHGGYLAAIVVRALTAAVDDSRRAARSVTLHYLRSPVEGDLEIEVTVERTGRSLSSLTARLSQDGRLCVVAIAAYSVAFESVIDYAPAPPDVRAPDQCKVASINAEAPSMARHFEVRPAIGARLLSGADSARTGGWIGLREPAAIDAALIALFTDSWLPAPYMRLQAWADAPTLDLTIHFRVPDAGAHVAPDEPILGVFDSRASADGFFDEEGELWSASGVLLAQSRQLGLLRAL